MGGIATLHARIAAGAAMLAVANVGTVVAQDVTDARRTPASVRVQVTDTAGIPVPDAEVALMHGLRTTVATARTNENGRHAFIVDLDSSIYSITARKVGYARGDLVFDAQRTDLQLTVRMKPLASLPAVTVRESNARRERYGIDADEIAASDVPLVTALDVVERLRPDILTTSTGTWGGSNRTACGPMSSIWVNDRRFPSGFYTAGLDVAVRARGGARVGRLGTSNMQMLADIPAEYVAELRYRDCLDGTQGRFGTTDALFVTLKPGVAFRPGRGALVIGDTTSVATPPNR